MKMKRITSALLALVMVLTALVIVPVAAEGIELPDAGFKPVAEEDKLTVDDLKAEGKTVMTMDEYNTAVRKDNNLKTFTNTYVSISTPQQWSTFANLVSSKGNWAGSTKNVTFFLTNDLDFNGVTGVAPAGIRYGAFKTPLADGGTNNASNVAWTTLEFKGHFDGNGYTIKNLIMQTNDYQTGEDSNHRGTNIYMGLFSSAGTGATLKNLVIDSTCYFAQNKNDDLGGYMGAAALLGAATGNVVIENIYNKANVKGGTHAAGIVGRDANPTITNCTNDGTIQAANTKGGIIGWTSAPTITGCVNNGTILGNGAGGICGRTRGAANITDCINNGILTGSGNNVNGIIAAVEQTYNATITNCVNTARFNLDWFRDNTATYLVRGIANHVGTGKITYNNCSSVLEPYSPEAYSGYSEWRVGAPVDLTSVVNINDYDANTSAASFKITDAAGLVKLSDIVNGGTTLGGKTIYLANDIDMTGVTMMPIGNFTDVAAACKSHVNNGGKLAKSTAFTGTFDGQGHTIDGLQMKYDYTETSSVALFGNGGTIKNLILGANCFFRMTGANDGYNDVGSISGRGATIINCANYATVYGSGNNAGGIQGRGTKVEYTTNYGAMLNGGNSGGITGFAGTINYCVNYGTVHALGQAGGMSGVVTNGTYTFTGNINYGTISSRAVAAGLYVTRTVTLNLVNCANYGVAGTTTGNGGVADLAANQAGNTLTLNETNCVSSGTIGYSEDLIPDVDLSFVPDITDIYEIVVEGTYDVETFGTNGVSNDPKTYTTIPKGVFKKIDASVADPKVLKISNAAGMRLFSAYINNYDAEKGAGKTFYLADDIDMSGYNYTWTDITLAAEKSFVPIGWERNASDGALADAKAFHGNFNGLGHTVSNLLLKGSGPSDNAGHRGLFGKVQEGVVANLIIDDSCMMDAGTGMYTVIAGVASCSNIATFSNIWNQMNINNGVKDAVTRMAAGIVAHATSTFVANATNSGYIGAFTRGGGLVAYGNGRVTLANSRNVGAIVSTNADGAQCVAGIQGFITGGSFVKNVENYGPVTIGKRNVGGLFNECGNDVMIDNCFNYGKLTTGEGFTANDVTASGTPKAGNLSYASGMSKAYSEDMLKVWYQTNSAGDVRLVTTIDGVAYDKIVLTITRADGAQATIEILGVYTSVLANDSINTVVETPENYGADTSMYFGAFTITGAQGQTFTVQATAYIDGQVVHTGAARTVTVA